MKLPQFFILIFLAAPALCLAQTGNSKRETTKQTHEYRRQTTKTQVRPADSSDLNAILKDSANAETGPILNDNGNVNSTGSIDGSRSSTGRPDADPASYTVKRKKTVIRSSNGTLRDTTGRRRKP
ncbi:hypothetical protein [Dyadobacter sp. MSC1_007]|jgi:hypothetical protein|uniref:hypothetical protein n=1 Tax=Dyadobacter sp. MSC1_007 TaxID=2909264 RepID=UPI0020309363|nr:hypothetical protein [Dyadobacter sp. MSC1_007]